MKMNKTFSIVIPAYNAENFICNALECVRGQTYQMYEVIVVNDGSKDSTESVVKSYMDEHPEMPVSYVYQQNGGAASARATGIDYAKNDFVAFLDADDIWYPQKLQRVNEVLENENVQVVYHDEYEIALDGRKRLQSYRSLSDEPLDDLIINGNALSTSTVVVERISLNASNTFKQGARAGEDIQCWIELAKNGARFWHICEALGEYRRTANSLTVSSVKYVEETGKMYVDFYDFLDKKKYTEDEIRKMKEERTNQNIYTVGRVLHMSGNYREARAKYKEVLRRGGLKYYKALFALLLADFRVRR